MKLQNELRISSSASYWVVKVIVPLDAFCAESKLIDVAAIPLQAMNTPNSHSLNCTFLKNPALGNSGMIPVSYEAQFTHISLVSLDEMRPERERMHIRLAYTEVMQ